MQNQENQNKKRTRVEVLYDILRVIQEKGGKIKPTHLMYKANLSHNSMAKHIQDLTKNAMIKKVDKDGKIFYEIAQKGRDFSNKYNQIKEFEKTFGL
jgi:predicted transcriptional regulator